MESLKIGIYECRKLPLSHRTYWKFPWAPQEVLKKITPCKGTKNVMIPFYEAELLHEENTDLRFENYHYQYWLNICKRYFLGKISVLVANLTIPFWSNPTFHPTSEYLWLVCCSCSSVASPGWNYIISCIHFYTSKYLSILSVKKQKCQIKSNFPRFRAKSFPL